MVKILLLEDDNLFAFSLIDYLEEFGDFEITHALNANSLLELTYKNRYDLYILDINLPDINGIDLLDELRTASDNTPAIFLTSYKDKDTLKKGFLKGADDFMTKPCDMDELILRINSLMKRCLKQSIISIGNISFNFDTKSVIKDGVSIKLGLKVLELFELFYQNNNQIVSKEMIINKLWNIDQEYSEGSIRVYVNHIKKLFDSEELFKISNIKNIGYKIEY
ncbi:MAG: response regulator transcription factor [Campylobacterota bacterium]|nr:response regulator transcription factor [Campylobacterota bacterium]